MPPAPPVLEASLRAEIDPARIVVDVTARAEPAALARWSLAVGDPPADVAATDDDGALPLVREGRALVAGRTPRGAVRVTYAAAPTSSVDDGTAVHVDPDRLHAGAERLLLLPEGLDDRAVPTRLLLDASRVEGAQVVATLGKGGTHEGTMRGRELRHVSLIAGRPGSAVLDAYEGHDEAGWLGFTRFDPRFAAAETAGVRSALADYFADRARLPFTLLILSDKRPSDPFAVSLRTRGLLVHAHLDAPWTAAARLPIATELARRWIGGALAIAGDPAASAWLSEGFARAVAREVSFGMGTLSPVEYADEVTMLLATQALSPLSGRANDELARSSERAARVLVATRGALYATRLDAVVRARSKGKKTLREVLRGLLATAQAAGAPLPLATFAAAIEAEAGTDERTAFERSVLAGGEVVLPDDALGPCFAAARVRHEAFDLGVTLAGVPGDAKDVRPGGPAHRAGLRDGERVVRASYAHGRAWIPAELFVVRDGKEVAIRYRPAGASAQGRAFAKRREVRDDQCVR